MSAVDLDNTTGCPLGVRCESCGVERDDLAVSIVELGRLGVACLTLCPPHAASGITPPVTVGTATRLVIAHCIHLGITVDDMAAVLAEDGDR
ncbi:MAG: hypothetical protein ACR2GH_23505 [Pseudonocardia sp.]